MDPHSGYSKCSSHSLCQTETSPKLSGLSQQQFIISYDFGSAGLSGMVLLALPGVPHKALGLWQLVGRRVYDSLTLRSGASLLPAVWVPVPTVAPGSVG